MEIIKNNQRIKYASREVFWKNVQNGNWEPEVFEVIDRYIKSWDVFIDVGAWNGVCSIYAHKLGAKCFSIEPDYKAYEEMISNCLVNNIIPGVDIKLFNSGISSETGASVLRSMNGDFGNSESSLLNRQSAAGMIPDERLITVQSFFDFIKTNRIPVPALIKIDVEGSEVLILKNTDTIKWLKKHKPNIYISFHPSWFNEADIKGISDVIFEIYKVTGKRGEYNKEMFNEAMNSINEHSFILIKP